MSAEFIPFLRPQVPPLSAYEDSLREMDASHLYSNYGPLNARFERQVVERLFGGGGHVVTMNNATSGLALALRQHSRPSGRYIVMPSFTFAATPLAARWAGFDPYFVDVDIDTWMVSEQAVTEAVSELGDEVAAVMPYATFGNNLDLCFYETLERQGVPVVVDAAASLGSRVRGTQFGAGFSGPVVYSMHATKPFSVGEAGLVHSNDAELIASLRRAGNFGFDGSRAAVEVGFNTKMPEMTAAVALATLETFGERMRRRDATHGEYLRALRPLIADGWSFQSAVGDVVHQFFPILAPQGSDGDAIVAALEGQGIQARRYFSPACHQQPVFVGSQRGDLSVTDELAARIISLPLWDGFSAAQVARVASALGAA